MAGRLLRGLLLGACLAAAASALRRGPQDRAAADGVAGTGLAQTRSEHALRGGEPCSAEAVCVEFHDRLGNNLYQFERALWLANKLNFCFVTVPLPLSKDAISAVVSAPEDGVVRLRRDAPNLTRAEVTQRCSVQCLECAPRRRAASVNLPTCHEWGPCDVGKRALKRPTIQMLRATMQESVVPTGLLRCNATATRLPEDTLVLHMRSGDSTARKARSGFYPQPPCAFYAAVMGHGNEGHSFPRAVIVTEKDLRHPCLAALQASFPGRVHVQSSSVAEDACTVAAARNLAISFGTWGPALSRLNANLRNLYVPFGEDGVTTDEYGGSLAGMSRHWHRQAFYEGGMPYAQHLYSFPGYRCEWSDQADHFARMLRYDASRVVLRTVPASSSSREAAE